MKHNMRVWMTVAFILLSDIHMSSADSNLTLNIGLFESWYSIFNTTLYEQRINIPWRTITLNITNPKSNFDKMLKAKAIIEKNDINIILGPYDDAVSTVTEKLYIPYVCTTTPKKVHRNSFHLMPPLSDFSQAMYDLVSTYEFDKISLFYDDDPGVFIMEKLLMNHDLLVKAWRIEKHQNHKEVQKQVREHLVHMRRSFVQKSILFCSRDHTQVILNQARSLAMLSTPYVWYFFDPGNQLTEIFSQFPDVVLNFTTFSLVNATFPHSISFLEKGNRLNTSLANDATLLLERAINVIPRETTVNNISSVLIDSFRNTAINGYTGHLEFNQNGSRVNYSILLHEVEGSESFPQTEIKSTTVGRWMSHPSAVDQRLSLWSASRTIRNFTFPLRNRKVDVVTILEMPFTMLKRDADLRLGNDKFEGYAVDLLTEIAKELKFEFNLYLVHDGKFGTLMPNKEWNGIIGELLAGNATLSVAPLSINSEREMAVDFTKPFMTRYISVLMRVPETQSTYFLFLNPLHHMVWFCTVGSFVIVSIILYFFEKFGVNHNKEYPPITFRESFWFVFGSLLQGSTESSPTTIPGRILTSAWWFFALILISSYTANLAAFLTVKKINTPINSVTDLASQTKITYGTVKDSGIMSFFQRTNIEHFAKMWAQMSEIKPSSMVDSTDEGFRKVKEEDYAFFWDTTVNKYKTIEDCNVMEIGPHFDPKGFGIGVPPGATYREELSMEILRLSDKGVLHELEEKWWGQRNCPDITKPTADETSELQIENVAGVFFILLGGIAFAAVVCGFEHFSKVIKRAAKKEKSAANGDSRLKSQREKESFL